MRVTIDSNITIHGVFEPPFVLTFEGDHVSLLDVLITLQKSCKSIELVSRNNNLGDDVDEIVVNGKSHCILSRPVSLMVREGDRIEVKVDFAPLGGG